MSIKASRFRGYSLIELIVTISIVSIAAVIAVPNFIDTIRSNRLTTQVNELVTSFNLARSEAIKGGVKVVVCKTNNGSSCVTSGGWNQGWMVFTDQSGNGSYESASDILIRVNQASPDGISIAGNTNVQSYVKYQSTGVISSGAGTITFCDGRSGNYGKSIVLVSTGRARIDSNVSC